MKRRVISELTFEISAIKPVCVRETESGGLILVDPAAVAYFQNSTFLKLSSPKQNRTCGKAKARHAENQRDPCGCPRITTPV